jgi:hypothetical protein
MHHSSVSSLLLLKKDCVGTRATIRVQEAGARDSVARESAPGKLKDEKTWQSWYDAFENMLSAFLGVNGSPLVYVIRKTDDPEPDGHNTFIKNLHCLCASHRSQV